MTAVTSKIFAVTGGASGIGAATCRLLAQRGAAVLCVGDIANTSFEKLKSSIKDINPCTDVHCTVLNVASSTEVEEWMRSIISTYGGLDGAANVAGIAQGAGIRQAPTILEETDESWHKIMKVNLEGVF
jgi:chanoclavine-I dehydrogenase